MVSRRFPDPAVGHAGFVSHVHGTSDSSSLSAARSLTKNFAICGPQWIPQRASELRASLFMCCGQREFRVAAASILIAVSVGEKPVSVHFGCQ